MNKLCVIIIFLLVVSCANRGYDSLIQEVPELFSDFDKNNYVELDLPQNTVYVEKKLPIEEKEITEFDEKRYIKKQNIKSYDYYVPKNRVSGSSSIKLFENLKRIKSSHNTKIDAILVE